MANTIQTKGIITINGKQVENTFQNIQKEARSLERDLKKLTIGSDEYVKKWAELKNANKYLDEHKQKLNETRKAAAESGTSISGFFDSSKSKANQLFNEVLSGQVSFKSLGGTIKAFAVESWAAISSIPLVGWLAAVAAGIGLVVKEAVDYNKEISPLLKLLDNLGLDKKIIPQLRAIKDAFGIETEQIANMLDNLVDAGIVKDQAAALDTIMVALSKAPNKAELITYLENSAETADKLGFSLEQIINIKQDLEGTPMNPEKVFGAMDTYVSRILSQSEKIEPVLTKTFGGDFANNLYKGLVNGSISYSDALKKVYDQGEKLKISDKERADLAKAFFGKSGASAYDYNQILKVVSGSYRDINENLSESQKRTLAIAQAQEELSKAQDKAYNSKAMRVFLGDFKLVWIWIQTKFYEIIALLRDDFKPIFETIGKFIDTVFIMHFRRLMNLISSFTGEINIFKLAWEYTLIPLKTIFLVLGSVFDIVKFLYNKILDFTVAIIKWGSSFGPVNSALNYFKSALSVAYVVMHKLYTFIANFPEAYHALETATKVFFKNLSLTFSSSAEALKHILKGIFTFDSNEISLGLEMIKNNLKSSLSNAGKIFTLEFNKNIKIKNDLATAEKEAEENAAKYNRETPETSGKGKDKKGTDKKAEAKKEEKDYYDELLSLQQKYEEEKAKNIDDSYAKELAEENNRRQKEIDDNKKQIADLEKAKIETKNLVAKANIQKSIDLINKIEEEQQKTHLHKLAKLREEQTAKDFQKFVEQEQRRINEKRRLDEDKINNISTMEEAELALSEMKYLKLTDQELKGIKTLEDAKRALRENADRAMLDAQLKSLEVQKQNLEKALEGLTGEAAEKLKANLEELKNKITQVKGAISGGNEQDSKKVADENKQKKESIDILGFSAQDWEESFKNLDTTEGKLKAIGMAFQALANAGQMFSELTRSLGERDLKNFERVQEKKKNAYTKQLNEGYITNEDYNKKIQKLERETANKKAELEYKQAKADKIARMFSIVGNTAVGISAALPNIPLAVVVGALGAVQLGIVAAQPLPEKQSFAEGGFTGYGSGKPDETGKIPAGIVHAREYVIPEAITMNPRYANIISWIESVRTGNAKVDSFADGGMVANAAASSSANTAPAITGMNYDADIKTFLQKNIELLEFLIENGVHLEESMQNARRLDKLQKEWNELTSKNKF